MTVITFRFEMHARVKLLVAYLWAFATLRSSPFGVNMLLRPPPQLYLYSCGRAEAPDHKETVLGGLALDICNLGTDHEQGGRCGSSRGAPRWEVFGGEKGPSWTRSWRSTKM